MWLKLYQISSTLEDNPNNRAILKDSSLHDDVFSFFMMNSDEEKKIKEIKLDFIAGNGYTLKNIIKTDYIFSFSAMLFSKRFVEKVGEILREEIEFYPCKIICQGVNLDWYAAKILYYYPFVDKKLSSYRTLTDERKVLKLVKYRKDIEEKFYVARDSEYKSWVAFSELFKNLCEENDFKINLEESFYFK